MSTVPETPVERIFRLPQSKSKNPIMRLLGYLGEGLFGLRKCDRIYAAIHKLPKETPFCERILQAAGVRMGYKESDLAKVPKEGPVVVVANHPFGGIEGVMLLVLLRKIRPDVKAMANYMLGTIPEMRDDFIFVDPFGSKNAIKTNLKPIKESLSWLKEGHLLIVFPSGEVSSFDTKSLRIRDPAWSPTVAAFTRKSNACVVPMYIPGRNTIFFYLMGLLHPRFRTMLLAHQFANKRGRVLKIRIGSPLSQKALEPFSIDDAQLTKYLRFRSYLLHERKLRRARHFITLHPPMMPAMPIIPSVPTDELEKEIEQLPESARLVAAGDFIVFIATAQQIPSCIREIGRLREITFRAVGEGTGNAIDLDKFDSYYMHLVMWNVARKEIAGSYRLGLSDKIIEAHGVKGLYTNTLFEFDMRLMEKLPPLIEMGRSFIRLEYQKAYTSLFLLWRGIAMFIARNPKYRAMFGPVSITNEYREASRCMILASMRQTCMDDELASLVKSKFPPHPPQRSEWCLPEYREMLNDFEHVAEYVSEIEPDGKDIPVLLRQYLKLGGRLLSFNLDPDFSSVVDGLIVVDLARTPLKTLRRYFGNEAEVFLKFHGMLEETAAPAADKEA
jgi:putative hemolysin